MHCHFPGKERFPSACLECPVPVDGTGVPMCVAGVAGPACWMIPAPEGLPDGEERAGKSLVTYLYRAFGLRWRFQVKYLM